MPNVSKKSFVQYTNPNKVSGGPISTSQSIGEEGGSTVTSQSLGEEGGSAGVAKNYLVTIADPNRDGKLTRAEARNALGSKADGLKMDTSLRPIAIGQDEFVVRASGTPAQAQASGQRSGVKAIEEEGTVGI